ncbi:hypothetical protein EP57_05945 [Listeria booriae]|uniref:Uncharacterized protein n=1 Tax=Listeria booriae TaxID=1552123 RepID=A0A099WED1_9LIST|nr:hypothetical protein EP57_05945 [Listeria booriae]
MGRIWILGKTLKKRDRLDWASGFYLLDVGFSNIFMMKQQLIPAKGMLIINHKIVLGKIS